MYKNEHSVRLNIATWASIISCLSRSIFRAFGSAFVFLYFFHSVSVRCS